MKAFKQRVLIAAPYFRPYQGHYFWKKALKELGCQVKVFWYNKSSFFTFQPNDKAGLFLISEMNNWRLKRLINSYQPEIFLYSSGVDVLTANTAKFVHSLGVKTALLSGVSPLRFATTSEKEMLEFVDCCFVNDSTHTDEWLQLGAKRAVCLPIAAIDSDFHRKVKLSGQEKKNYQADICFVGSLSDERQKVLINLIEQLPRSVSLKIWGHIYSEAPLRPQLQSFYQGEAWEDEAVKIFNAVKIGLNFLPGHMPVGGNMRTFEIPGCGALQLVDRLDPSWFKTGKEVVVFEDLEDLKKKIKYYLGHDQECRAIAQAGYRRAHREHTYEKRFKKLIAGLGFLDE